MKKDKNIIEIRVNMCGFGFDNRGRSLNFFLKFQVWGHSGASNLFLKCHLCQYLFTCINRNKPLKVFQLSNPLQELVSHNSFFTKQFSFFTHTNFFIFSFYCEGILLSPSHKRFELLPYPRTSNLPDVRLERT